MVFPARLSGGPKMKPRFEPSEVLSGLRGSDRDIGTRALASEAHSTLSGLADTKCRLRRYFALLRSLQSLRLWHSI